MHFTLTNFFSVLFNQWTATGSYNNDMTNESEYEIIHIWFTHSSPPYFNIFLFFSHIIRIFTHSFIAQLLSCYDSMKSSRGDLSQLIKIFASMNPKGDKFSLSDFFVASVTRDFWSIQVQVYHLFIFALYLIGLLSKLHNRLKLNRKWFTNWFFMISSFLMLDFARNFQDSRSTDNCVYQFYFSSL